MTKFILGSSTSLAVLGAMLGLSATVSAQDAEDRSPQVEDVILVTSIAGTLEAEVLAAQTPGGAGVVRHEDFADRFLVSLRDTLAFAPGVYTQPRYGQEVRIAIRGSGLSRGYHMRGLTLLQDGAPINLADDNGDFQEMEPIFFDHLEVYRGSNALRFGSGTLGGAINGVTPTGLTSEGVYVRADVGSFNTARLLVSKGGTRGILDAWGAISTDRSDGDREHAERASLRFNGNLGIQLTDRIETRFYLSTNEINQDLPGALTRAVALSDPQQGNSVNDQGRDIDSVRIQNQTRIRLDNGLLQVGVFANDKSLHHPIFQVIDYDSKDRGGFVRWTRDGDVVEFTLGGEARTGQTDARRFLNINGSNGALAFSADQSAWTANFYGEARWHASNALTLVAGAIYARGEREQTQSYNLFAGGPSFAHGEAEFEAFSPKLGALYAVSDEIQLYANLSASAEFPGLGELAQIASFVPVEEQRAGTFEIGSRGRSGIAEWDVSFYRSQIDGEMLQYTVGPDIPASTFNAGDTLHQGLEAALSLQFTDWLRLRQIYNWSDFRFDGDAQYGDNTLPVVPEHVLRTELRFGSDALNIAPIVEWVPTGAWADYTNTTRTSSYVMVSLTAGWSVTERVDLFLDARNLTDVTAAGDVSAVITVTDASSIYYPVERRAVFGGVRTRF